MSETLSRRQIAPNDGYRAHYPTFSLSSGPTSPTLSLRRPHLDGKADDLATGKKSASRRPPVPAAYQERRRSKPASTSTANGRTTAEAVELAALAKAQGLVTAIGLQARVNSAVIHLKELVAAG